MWGWEDWEGWEDELKSHLRTNQFPGSVLSYAAVSGQAILIGICGYYFVQEIASFVIDALNWRCCSFAAKSVNKDYNKETNKPKYDMHLEKE